MLLRAGFGKVNGNRPSLVRVGGLWFGRRKVLPPGLKPFDSILMTGALSLRETFAMLMKFASQRLDGSGLHESIDA